MTLRARKTRFRWDSAPRDWLAEDPQTQRVIDALHLLLPTGERWFCRLFARAADRITDPALRADLDGFIRQEGWHANAHAEVLVHFERHGIDIAPHIREVEWMFDQIGGDRPFGLSLPEQGWLEFRIAVIAAIEHYFCALGMWILTHDGLDEAGADPTMLDLLRWHAAEEVEHRAVAFDVTRALGVGWPRRYLAYILVLPLFVTAIVRGARFLATREPWRDQPRPSMFAFARAGRRGTVPSLGYIVRATLRFASPFYDPRREGSTATAYSYLGRSRAVKELG